MAGRPQRRARLAAENAVLEFGPLSPRPNPLQRTVNDGPICLDYNDPNIGSKDFLFAVMWDQSVDLDIRMRAAELLLPITEPMPATVRVPAPPSTIPVLTIRITGLSAATVDAADEDDHHVN